MTSKIVVNNIEADSGISTVAFNDQIRVGSATTIHSTGVDLGSGNINSHNINSTGIITATGLDISGNVSIGGTLTYEDVTYVDSVGIITAQAGIHVTGGSVGIGTDNPISNLQVFGTNGIRITNSANQNATTLLNFESNHPAFRMLNASGDTTVKFKSDGNSFITSGNLGIGTATPGAILSLPAGESNTPRFAIESAVDDNDFTITQYEDGNGTYTMLGQNVKLDSGGNNTILDSGHRTAAIQLDARHHGSLTFYTGAANVVKERIRLTNTGALNIGIGTESGPGMTANLVEMYVGSIDDSYAIIRGKYNRTNEFNRSEVRFGVESNATGSGFLALATGTNSATEKVRITAAGKVGILNSNPTYDLDLLKTASGVGATMRVGATAVSGNNTASVIINNGGTGDAVLDFKYEGQATPRASISVYQSEEALRFKTNGQQRLYLDDDGNMRLGSDTSTVTRWGGGVPTFDLKGNDSGQPTRSGFLGFESYSGTDGYGGIWLSNDQLKFYMGEARQDGGGSYVTPKERIRIKYDPDYPSVGISTDGTFHSNQNFPFNIYGQGFSHTWTQGGTSQDAVYLTAGASGNYGTCRLEVSAHSWGSVVYEIHAGAYSSKGLHRIGSFYQNGSSITGHSGSTTYTNGGASISVSGTGSQTFRIDITGGTWTHPSAWVTFAHSGGGSISYNDVQFYWI